MHSIPIVLKQWVPPWCFSLHDSRLNDNEIDFFSSSSERLYWYVDWTASSVNHPSNTLVCLIGLPDIMPHLSHLISWKTTFCILFQREEEEKKLDLLQIYFRKSNLRSRFHGNIISTRVLFQFAHDRFVPSFIFYVSFRMFFSVDFVFIRKLLPIYQQEEKKKKTFIRSLSLYHNNRASFSLLYDNGVKRKKNVQQAS